MTTVLLQSEDDQQFSVLKNVVECSATIKNMLSDMGVEQQIIPLPNIKGKTLKKILEFCQQQIENPTVIPDEKKDEKRTDNISEWDKTFCNVDIDFLFELILGANYLDIKPLLDLTCKTVANMIKGKTPEEIRTKFNIKSDFTPEEEEQVRKENEWCEER